MADSTIRGKRLERQGYHLLAFVALGVLQYFAILHATIGRGLVWGLSTMEWVVLAWAFAGLFHAWVAFFWRMELYGGWVSARFGRAGFTIHRIGYGVLGFLSFALLIPICVSTRETLPLSPAVAITLIVVTTPPILWALYGAAVHFGFTRASGADHFDPAYRGGSMEQHGIYKYVPNSMYSVALLGLYHPGLLWFSTLGLIVAAAHHAFVWAHYFCTEKPDLRTIYGTASVVQEPRI